MIQTIKRYQWSIKEMYPQLKQQITKEDKKLVERLGKLSNITIQEKEVAGISEDMRYSLAWISSLGEVDVEGVEPLHNPSIYENKQSLLRADQINMKPSYPHHKSNSPDYQHPYFLSPNPSRLEES